VQSTGKLKFGCEEEHHFCAEDLVDCGEIGRGNYGAVNKMRFRKNGKIMAVKRIR
jgi:mitogen-activated protein kinase kinase 4